MLDSYLENLCKNIWQLGMVVGRTREMKKDYVSLVKFLKTDYPWVYADFLAAEKESHMTLKEIKKRFDDRMGQPLKK